MRYDVIVIGGGHAGVEAACAAARRGAAVALVTFDARQIGAMSCNPAIGGVGKGHLVREVDAFDGVIARAADAAAIHHRMLNRSKGPAVHGPRVQADRRLFAKAVQTAVSAESNITIVEGEAVALEIESDTVRGIELTGGSRLAAPSVILASGTFLGGRLFRGLERGEGGREGERAASALGQQLRALGLPVARLKTGTPPRLDGRTIDWAKLAEQPSDAEPWTMSAMPSPSRLPQLRCAIARTNGTTHSVIRKSFDTSPLFGGDIDGQGPRYCPSIEDKIHRFGDRDGHQLFLEPEGLDTPLVYPNGFSTSLSADAQVAAIHTIVGLECAAIVTPGYAVEYDYLDPRSLDHHLAHRTITGLFCAGQINGTTGYEEAAGQGLIAGINAAAHALDLERYRPDRGDSYLGVMIDDLVLQGVSEPYRMLTARAEYRLRLRADNAETRLSDDALRLGMLSQARQRHVEQRGAARHEIEAMLDQSFSASALAAAGAAVPIDAGRRRSFEWLRFPAVPIDAVLPDHAELDPDVLAEVVADARYAPYTDRQDAEIAMMAEQRTTVLPTAIDYRSIPGLSNEMVERLEAVMPRTLDEVTRIRGITPAAVTTILLHSRKRVA